MLQSVRAEALERSPMTSDGDERRVIDVSVRFKHITRKVCMSATAAGSIVRRVTLLCRRRYWRYFEDPKWKNKMRLAKREAAVLLKRQSCWSKVVYGTPKTWNKIWSNEYPNIHTRPSILFVLGLPHRCRSDVRKLMRRTNALNLCVSSTQETFLVEDNRATATKTATTTNLLEDTDVNSQWHALTAARWTSLISRRRKERISKNTVITVEKWRFDLEVLFGTSLCVTKYT